MFQLSNKVEETGSECPVILIYRAILFHMSKRQEYDNC